jgi:hypothetical protein
MEHPALLMLLFHLHKLPDEANTRSHAGRCVSMNSRKYDIEAIRESIKG